MQFSDKAYEVLKWVSMVVCPGIGTFYAIVASAFGWGYIKEVALTCMGAGAFLGSLIGISTAEYRRNIANTGIEEVIQDAENR